MPVHVHAVETQMQPSRLPLHKGDPPGLGALGLQAEAPSESSHTASKTALRIPSAYPRRLLAGLRTRVLIEPWFRE